MDVSRIYNRVSLFLLEDLSANNFVSGLILFNNLLYNLHFSIWESVHLEKNSWSNIACVE